MLANCNYIHYVSENMIPNSPGTVQDVINTECIWGRDLGGVKGKTVRQISPKVRVENTSILVSIMQQYRNVTRSVDIMEVIGIPFVMTISSHIKFRLVGKLDGMKNSHILKYFKALIGAYVTRGFRVTIMLADNQFEPMCGSIADLHAQLLVISQDKYVQKIERYSRTVKEQVRGNYNIIPFQQLPPVVVI